MEACVAYALQEGCAFREEFAMNIGKPRVLLGILAALPFAILLTFKFTPVLHAAEGDEVEYTFGRPIQQDEQTYDWYRKLTIARRLIASISTTMLSLL